jgi:hypothetical protein
MIKVYGEEPDKMTYKGYTIEQIKSFVDYDPDSGLFHSKKTKKELINRDFTYREEGSKTVTCFRLARVAVMFMTDDYLSDNDRITFKDDNPYNHAYSNLVVVPYKDVYQNRHNNPTNTYLETEHEHIYVGSLNKLFVVRRGIDQGIYRTYSKEEAVAVRDRWIESGKTLHEWDTFCPKWFKRMTKEQESEEIMQHS